MERRVTSSSAPAYVKKFIDALPASALIGETIYDKRNRIIISHIPNHAPLVVKRFHKLNIIQKIGRLFRGTKASRAYDNALALKARGFATPEPFGYVELPDGFTYYVTAYTDFTPIQVQLEHPAQFNEALAEAFGRYVAALHEAGILHHDLNSTNVLFDCRDGRYTFTLIDINRMRFFPVGNVPCLDDCVANMLRFTGRLDVLGYVARAYAHARGLDEDSFAARALRAKRRHDTLWRLRKRLCHPLRKRKP